MEWVDLLATISSFHGLVMAWLYWQRPTWNVLTLLWFFMCENAANMVGHCGYDLPHWLTTVMSLGSLGTPWSQNAQIHYVHHVRFAAFLVPYLLPFSKFDLGPPQVFYELLRHL
jgi:sterol desaturase/sphingolipid hydroxylase (fatty acid hydroxylase superfamily)